MINITEMFNKMDLSSNAKRYNYGSIDLGLKVSEYRGEQIAKYIGGGMNYAMAASKAQIDVLVKFGEPKHETN